MHIYRVARLKEKKHRKESGQFLVEGDKAVLEAVSAHARPSPYGPLWEVIRIFGTASFIESYGELISAKKIPYSVVDAGELRKAGSMEVQSGAIAVVNNPQHDIRYKIQDIRPDAATSPLSYIFNPTSSRIALALDGIKDPGNLGTIIRTAEWFGVGTILLGSDTVDMYNPKCIAATMGSFLRVRCIQVELEDVLRDAKKAGIPVYATAMKGTSLAAFTAQKPCILVMGSESHGVKPKLLGMADDVVTIPKHGMAESLNVGVATGIILSHITQP